MRLLILILILLSASTSWAGPGAKKLASVMQSTKYDISSFEASNDGWTFAYCDRYNTINSAYSALDGGAWGLRRVEGPNTSTATKTITTANGYISFWYKSTYDGTKITVDGADIASPPANSGVWTKVSAPLSAGTHTIVLTMAYTGIYDYIMIPIP